MGFLLKKKMLYRYNWNDDDDDDDDDDDWNAKKMEWIMLLVCCHDLLSPSCCYLQIEILIMVGNLQKNDIMVSTLS